MRNICRLSVLALVSFCSALMTPMLSAQPKKAQPVLLTRGSGEIFYKKGEGTSKPKLTEVDVSQYAAGNLYGELKVSGTCDGFVWSGARSSDRGQKGGPIFPF